MHPTPGSSAWTLQSSRERSTTVALSQSDLSDLLDAIRAGGDLDVVRRSVELVLQALIDAEATEVIGAEPHERTPMRTNSRNGSRDRLLSTKRSEERRV